MLKKEDKICLFMYYKALPEPVFPRYYSTDLLLFAFDFKRDTYRWVYDNDASKSLTATAAQKIIRLAVATAQLRKGISYGIPIFYVV